MPTGFVKKLLKEKGFGFIRPDDGGADLFAPLRTFSGDEDTLSEGDRVTYDMEVEERTQKPKAASWSVDSATAASLLTTLSGNPYGANGVVVGGYGPTSIMTSLDRSSPYGLPGTGSALPTPALAVPPTLLPGLAGMPMLSAAGLAANTSAAPRSLAGWEMTTDPASGKLYYFNRATQESSWDPPT
mmetsp:Transcript_29792/g.36508  ORF Transcript_29792/g.36508 Transcript_29792/m.36508 type:complete len:186 (-) Transcript_29792:13-570(-)